MKCILILIMVLPLPLTAAQFPSETKLALPYGAVADWVIAPLTEEFRREAKIDWDSVGFGVDEKGGPWFGDSKSRMMFDLVKDDSFLLSEPFTDFAWSSDGRLWVLTETALGSAQNPVQIELNSDDPPIALFNPSETLPYKGLSLAVGDGGSVYLWGKNPKSQKYDVYLLKFAEGKKTSAAKIFAGDEKIEAVAGDGDSTYVAVDRMVLWVGGSEKRIEPVFQHPKEKITGLAFSKEVGLFYATPSAVGFAGKKSDEFLQAPMTRLFLRDDGLYILIGKSYGVVKITGLPSFRWAGVGEPLPEEIKLALPKSPGLAAQWVVPPSLKSEEVADFFRFDVDKEGQPWFGYYKKYIINPLIQAGVQLKQSYEDFSWLDSGELILCSNGSLGFLDKEDASKAAEDDSVLPFKSILSLPYKNFRLYPGSGNRLYLLGENPADSSHELYLLRLNEEEKVEISKLLTIEQKITAVAGDGERTYVAMGRRVLKLHAGKAELIFALQKEDIQGLAFSPMGLFYTTASGVGLVTGPGKLIKFLESPKSQIRIRGNTLFVYLGRYGAVIKIDGANKLHQLQAKVTP